MKIAICDDDSAYVKKIESVVRTTLAEKNIDARSISYLTVRNCMTARKHMIWLFSISG